MNAGDLIREARLRARLTQLELAARSGTTQSAISRWERGRSEPGVDTLRRLVEACGQRLEIDLGSADVAPVAGFEENLRLDPTGRLDQLVRTVRFIEAGRRAMRRSRA